MLSQNASNRLWFYTLHPFLLRFCGNVAGLKLLTCIIWVTIDTEEQLSHRVRSHWLNPHVAYLCLCVEGVCICSTCSTPVPARRTMGRLLQVLLVLWSVIAAVCSLLSSLLLDAEEECAGHSFLGSCQLKPWLSYKCGCKTATPAHVACTTSSLLY